MIERDVVLPAGTDEVWRALTDPEILEEWFGADVHWELSPGAPARFGSDDGDRDGLVADVEPGRRLRFLWWPEGDEGDVSEVAYELQPSGGGTQLTVTERRVVAAPAPDASRRGVAPEPSGPDDPGASGVPEASAAATTGAVPASAVGWAEADQVGFERWAAAHTAAPAGATAGATTLR